MLSPSKFMGRTVHQRPLARIRRYKEKKMGRWVAAGGFSLGVTNLLAVLPGEVFRNEDQLSSSLHGKERNKKEKMKGKSGEG